MGLFCVNFHLRTTDGKAAKAAIHKCGAAQHFVLPAKDGWISLYEEQASMQDEERIRDLTGRLSRELRIPAIAFLVHDSDIACYWLFDRGKLQDEFNSYPDYFDGGTPGACGGRPEVLLPYCRKDFTEDDLAAILAGQPTFADDVVTQLAEALGIDPERALTDYRDLADGDGPDGLDGFDGGDDDDGGGDGDGGDDEDGPRVIPFPTELANQVARQFGGQAQADSADSAATALVNAAAAGDTAEIERLLAEGAAIDAEAPAPFPDGGPAGGLAQLIPSGLMQFPMTPLLTAVLHQQQRAVERLLEVGADPNRVHPLFGTALHVATGAGNVDLLGLLIDRGGKLTVVNRQGQTPLAVVAASRDTIDRLATAKAAINSLGMKLPGILDNLSAASLPTAGWDACERLLIERGAR